MSFVDTRTGDFLRQRFAIEAARAMTRCAFLTLTCIAGLALLAANALSLAANLPDPDRRSRPSTKTQTPYRVSS